MASIPDSLTPRLAPSVQRKLDALERRKNPLTLEQWAILCLQWAPEAYTDPPEAREATRARPGSDTKIELMAARVEAGCSPFCAEDERLEHTAEFTEEAIDAGNGMSDPEQTREVMEFHDRDRATEKERNKRQLRQQQTDADPTESLADRCRRWVREDQARRRQRTLSHPEGRAA